MMKKILVSLLITSSLLVSGAFADKDDYGSAGVDIASEYSIDEMLIYAIQDEYLAKSEYEKIIEEYGEVRPFINIVKSEEYHISLLLPLIEKYEVFDINDSSEDYVLLPDSLTEAYKIGVIAEENNIEMYNIFLENELPDDIREVFEILKNSSENHLKAFERGLERDLTIKIRRSKSQNRK